MAVVMSVEHIQRGLQMLQNQFPKSESASKPKNGRTLFLLALIAGSAVSADAATYKFTILAADGDVIGGQAIHFPDSAVLNDSGVVAFHAFTGSAFQPIYNVYQTSLSTLPAGPSQVAPGQQPKINNSGTILFRCTAAGLVALCTQSGVVAKVGDTIGGQRIQYINNWTIGGSGAIVFTADLAPSSTSSVHATGLLTPSALLLKGCDIANFTSTCYAGGAHGDTIGGMELLSPYAPVINNSGGIAFYCDFGPSRVGICTPSAILARSGSIIGGHTLTLFGFPAINNSGTVAFYGEFDPNSGALFTPSSVLVQPGATIDSRLLDVTLQSPASINDVGTIVFTAHFQAQGSAPQGWGLFTKSGLVLKQGDTIGGKTVADWIGASINNRGVILVKVSFGGGASAIVIAEPQAGAQPLVVAIAIKPGDRPPLTPGATEKSRWPFFRAPASMLFQ